MSKDQELSTPRRISDEALGKLRALFAEQAERGATVFHQAHAEELLAIADELIGTRSETKGWIDATDRLPDHANDVLVWHCLGDRATCDHAYDVASYINEKWIFPWDRDRRNNPPQWVRKWKEIERV